MRVKIVKYGKQNFRIKKDKAGQPVLVPIDSEVAAATAVRTFASDILINIREALKASDRDRAFNLITGALGMSTREWRPGMWPEGMEKR